MRNVKHYFYLFIAMNVRQSQGSNTAVYTQPEMSRISQFAHGWMLSIRFLRGPPSKRPHYVLHLVVCLSVCPLPAQSQEPKTWKLRHGKVTSLSSKRLNVVEVNRSKVKVTVIVSTLSFLLSNLVHYLKPKGHIYELLRRDSEMHKKSFLPCCLLNSLRVRYV